MPQSKGFCAGRWGRWTLWCFGWRVRFSSAACAARVHLGIARSLVGLRWWSQKPTRVGVHHPSGASRPVPTRLLFT